MSVSLVSVVRQAWTRPPTVPPCLSSQHRSTLIVTYTWRWPEPESGAVNHSRA